jgi:hypothetical protein
MVVGPLYDDAARPGIVGTTRMAPVPGNEYSSRRAGMAMATRDGPVANRRQAGRRRIASRVFGCVAEDPHRNGAPMDVGLTTAQWAIGTAIEARFAACARRPSTLGTRLSCWRRFVEEVEPRDETTADDFTNERMTRDVLEEALQVVPAAPLRNPLYRGPRAPLPDRLWSLGHLPRVRIPVGWAPRRSEGEGTPTPMVR